MNYFLFFLFNLEQCPNNNRSIPSNIYYIISLHITPESKQKCKKKYLSIIVFVLCSRQENNIYIYIYICTHTIHGRRIKSNSCKSGFFHCNNYCSCCFFLRSNSCKSSFFIEKHRKREKKKNNTEKKKEKRKKTTKKSYYCQALLKTTIIEEPVAALFETVGIGILLQHFNTGAS